METWKDRSCLLYCFLLVFECVNTSTDQQENEKWIRLAGSQTGVVKENIHGEVTVISSLSCAHRCGRAMTCKNIAVRPNDVNRNVTCLVNNDEKQFEVVDNEKADNTQEFWILQELMTKFITYGNCDAVYEAGFRQDGLYIIAGIGFQYCFLSDDLSCGKGGWTLAALIDPSKTNFKWGSSQWSTKSVFMEEYGLQNPLNQEAKYSAFLSMSFSSLCIGMETGNTRKWIVPVQNAKYESLHNIFQRNTYIGTNVPKSSWLSLGNGFVLQNNCNRQGLNAMTNVRNARIGILSNEQADCATCDTAVGLGLRDRSCGNTGSANTPSKCFILIK